MSDNPITNVLNLLRLLKHNSMFEHNMYENVRRWCGEDATDSSLLRLFAYGLDQCQMAKEAIQESSLTEEAKTGLIQIVESLQTCFMFPTASNAIRGQIPQLDSAISSFAILASIYKDDISTASNSDLIQLIDEVNSVYNLFDSTLNGSPLKQLAKRHLQVLLTTLRHVDAFGIDSALSVYAELVVRLNTAVKSAPPEDAEKTSQIWPTIVKWGDRLAKIGNVVGSGSKLIKDGSDIAHTLIGFNG
ncbi:MAG: hypothetical protein KGQ75_02925 [Sphingomonadales bacterium]|nr:hypothetical protein [Sphingomonadales bacterium]